MPASDGRDEQRQRVIDTAAHLFAEHGFDDVTMAEIAAEADVARATVFNYFGSKHALIEAITEGVLDFYTLMLDVALADEETSTPDLMRSLCADMAKGIESQRRLFKSVFREIARVQLGIDTGDVSQRAYEQNIERLIQLVERGQARGDIDTSFDAAAIANAFHSLTNGTITHWLYQDPTSPLSARMRDVAEVFLAPVAVQRARRTRPKGRRT